MTGLFSPRVRLSRAVERAARQPGGYSSLTHDQAATMLREVRKVIEQDKSQDCFPTSKFYADWILHPEINNAVALGLIERFNVAFLNDEPLNFVVSLALGMDKLRQETICSFDLIGVLPELPDTSSLWLRFSSLVLHLVAHQPVGFRTVAHSDDVKGITGEIIRRLRIASAARFGVSRNGHCFFFDRFAILEPEGDDPYFRWRLEILLEDGSRLGKFGRIIFHDPNPFRIDDLGLRPARGQGEIQRAVDGFLKNLHIKDSLVVLQKPQAE